MSANKNFTATEWRKECCNKFKILQTERGNQHSFNVVLSFQLPDTETLLFRDGKRRIDMVLVYEEEDYGVMTFAEVTRREMRRVFQENLIKEGLELELEEKQVSQSKLQFQPLKTDWSTYRFICNIRQCSVPV